MNCPCGALICSLDDARVVREDSSPTAWHISMSNAAFIKASALQGPFATISLQAPSESSGGALSNTKKKKAEKTPLSCIKCGEKLGVMKPPSGMIPTFKRDLMLLRGAKIGDKPPEGIMQLREVEWPREAATKPLTDCGEVVEKPPPLTRVRPLITVSHLKQEQDRENAFIFSDLLVGALTPRLYQLEGYIHGLLQDTIIALPTGSGKTLVAALILSRMAELNAAILPEVRKKVINDDSSQRGEFSHKRGIGLFVVNKIVLVEQQAAALSSFTGRKVLRMHGDNTASAIHAIAACDPDEEDDERGFGGGGILLVATAQVIYNHMQPTTDSKGRTRPPRLHWGMIHTVVFDECHHNTGDHPYMQITRSLNEVPRDCLPRVIGLSATPVDSGVVASRGIEAALETHKSCYPMEIAVFVPPSYCADERAIETITWFAPKRTRRQEDVNTRLRTMLRRTCFEIGLDVTRLKFSTSPKPLRTSIFCELAKIEVGSSRNVKASLVREIEKLLDAVHHNHDWGPDCMLAEFQEYEQSVPPPGPMEASTQDKETACGQLLHLLRQHSGKKIVFVERQCHAFWLERWLSVDCGLRHVFALTGSQSSTGMVPDEQRRVVSDFRSNQEADATLICTSVAEEGLDIPQCNLVLFANRDVDLNLRRFIQVKGRAREVEKHIVYFVEQMSDKEEPLKQYRAWSYMRKELQMKQTSSLVFASRKAAEVLRSCEGFTTRDFPNDLLRRETNNNDADDDDDEMKEFGQSDEGDHNGSASSLHDLLVEMSSSGHFETAWAIRANVDAGAMTISDACRVLLHILHGGPSQPEGWCHVHLRRLLQTWRPSWASSFVDVYDSSLRLSSDANSRSQSPCDDDDIFSSFDWELRKTSGNDATGNDNTRDGADETLRPHRDCTHLSLRCIFGAGEAPHMHLHPERRPSSRLLRMLRQEKQRWIVVAFDTPPAIASERPQMPLDEPHEEQLLLELAPYFSNDEHRASTTGDASGSTLRTEISSSESDMRRLASRFQLAEFAGGIVQRGVRIFGRLFEFVAASQSQLRATTLSAVFVESCMGYRTAAQWRDLMLPLHSQSEKLVGMAKYVSRLGLFCSSDKKHINLPQSRILRIDDVRANSRSQDILTDGCGFALRSLLSSSVEESCSIIQIRYLGCKGVLLLVDDLTDVIPGRAMLHNPTAVVALRDSQWKFDHSFCSELCILREGRPEVCLLNREILALVSALCRKEETSKSASTGACSISGSALARFEGNILDLTDQHLQRIVRKFNGSDEAAAQQLRRVHASFPPHVQLGADSPRPVLDEPFLLQMLQQLYRLDRERLIRKLHVPLNEACRLLGCADPFGLLKDGEIFAIVPTVIIERQSEARSPVRVFASSPLGIEQIRDRHGVAEWTALTGPVGVFRNPCLHPGDLQQCKAVDLCLLDARYAKLRGVLLFPANAETTTYSIPHRCSGGDLDGDEFAVLWDCTFVSYDQFPHGDYDAQIPQNQKVSSETSTAPDEDRLDADNAAGIASLVTKCMKNNAIGIVANMHAVLCELLEEGACAELARQVAMAQSVAVDFVKTGILPRIPRSALQIRAKHGYPDYLAFGNASRIKKTFVSTSIIGKVFRKCSSETVPLSNKECYANDSEKSERSFNIHLWKCLIETNSTTALELHENLQNTAGLFCDFARDLSRLRKTFRVSTEAELFAGPSSDKDIDDLRTLEHTVQDLMQQFWRRLQRHTNSAATLDTLSALCYVFSHDTNHAVELLSPQRAAKKQSADNVEESVRSHNVRADFSRIAEQLSRSRFSCYSFGWIGASWAHCRVNTSAELRQNADSGCGVMAWDSQNLVDLREVDEWNCTVSAAISCQTRMPLQPGQQVVPWGSSALKLLPVGFRQHKLQFLAVGCASQAHDFANVIYGVGDLSDEDRSNNLSIENVMIVAHEHPPRVECNVQWVNSVDDGGEVVSLFLDFLVVADGAVPRENLCFNCSPAVLAVCRLITRCVTSPQPYLISLGELELVMQSTLINLKGTPSPVLLPSSMSDWISLVTQYLDVLDGELRKVRREVGRRPTVFAKMSQLVLLHRDPLVLLKPSSALTCARGSGPVGGAYGSHGGQRYVRGDTFHDPRSSFIRISPLSVVRSQTSSDWSERCESFAKGDEMTVRFVTVSTCRGRPRESVLVGDHGRNKTLESREPCDVGLREAEDDTEALCSSLVSRIVARMRENFAADRLRVLETSNQLESEPAGGSPISWKVSCRFGVQVLFKVDAAFPPRSMYPLVMIERAMNRSLAEKLGMVDRMRNTQRRDEAYEMLLRKGRGSEEVVELSQCSGSFASASPSTRKKDDSSIREPARRTLRSMFRTRSLACPPETLVRQVLERRGWSRDVVNEKEVPWRYKLRFQASSVEELAVTLTADKRVYNIRLHELSHAKIVILSPSKKAQEVAPVTDEMLVGISPCHAADCDLRVNLVSKRSADGSNTAKSVLGSIVVGDVWDAVIDDDDDDEEVDEILSSNVVGSRNRTHRLRLNPSNVTPLANVEM